MPVKWQSFIAAGRQCVAGLPDFAPGEKGKAVYLSGGDSLKDRLPQLEQALEGEMGKTLFPFALIAVTPKSWEEEFSPWAAPALSRKTPAFTGGGDKYLRDLAGPILQECEERLPLLPGRENRALAGYSLAGLSTLYALYQTETFAALGSVSGSLWFEGFLDYMEKMTPRCRDTRVYLSLGNKEEKSRHPLMRQVGDKTRRAIEVLEAQLTAPCTLEWNEGGHFDGVSERLCKAIRWMMEKK